MPLDFDAPLFDTLFTRRTRRFPQGGKIVSRRAGLNYASSEKPLPLTEEETALLCFAAAGVTGVTIEEIRHLLGHLTVSGRAAGSPCASLTMNLFFTNDDGVFLYKGYLEQQGNRAEKVRIRSKEDRKKILEDFRATTVKLKDGRIDIPRSAIGSAFESMVNLPGTTIFIPVADTTREYINMLFTGLAQFRWQLWDEVADKPAGVGRWIESGFLSGKRMTISQYDAMLPWLCNLEAGMAMQSLALGATAIGLGSFMMHTIDLPTVMKALSMRFEKKSGTFPQANDNPVGIDSVLEGCCPPYKPLDKAVDEIAALKWGPEGIYGEKGYNLHLPSFYETIVEVAKQYCLYLYNTYGRFPKYSDAMFIPILAQVHHCDRGFYEGFFPEYLSDADRRHVSRWHAGSSDSFPRGTTT